MNQLNYNIDQPVAYNGLIADSGIHRIESF